jgi:hypothetical protein
VTRCDKPIPFILFCHTSPPPLGGGDVTGWMGEKIPVTNQRVTQTRVTSQILGVEDSSVEEVMGE